MTEALGERYLDLAWRYVELAERLTPSRLRETLRPELEAAASTARAAVAPLERWPLVSERVFEIQSSDLNRVRTHHAMQALRPGDSVFDIGINNGYPSAIFLRDARLSRYHGTDIVPAAVESAAQALEVNGIAHDAATFAVGDLYDLTADELRERDVDVVLLMEVLEHVDDAERALSTVAAAMPDDARLLLSVPLSGRLEWVWGHASVFPARRLRALLNAVGLRPHQVDVVQAQWVVVVATKDANPSREALDALGSEPFVFATAALPGDDGGGVAVDGDEVRLTAAVPGFAVARVELGVEDPSAIASLDIAATDAEGRRIASWAWDAGPRAPLRERATFVLRSGERSQPQPILRPVERGDTARAAAIDVVATVTPGRRTPVRLHRAGYLPAP